MLDASNLPTDIQVMDEQSEEFFTIENAQVNAVILLATLNPTELDVVGKRKYTSEQAKLILAAADLVEDWKN